MIVLEGRPIFIGRTQQLPLTVVFFPSLPLFARSSRLLSPLVEEMPMLAGVLLHICVKCILPTFHTQSQARQKGLMPGGEGVSPGWPADEFNKASC